MQREADLGRRRGLLRLQVRLPGRGAVRRERRLGRPRCGLKRRAERVRQSRRERGLTLRIHLLVDESTWI